LEGSLKLLKINMTPDLRAEISALSIKPPHFTGQVAKVATWVISHKLTQISLNL
jgi:hypothetical protein